MPFAQDAAQTLAYPLVQWFERCPVAVFEIAKPASERSVDVFDDFIHPARSKSRRLPADRFLELVQALLAWPAIAPLKVIPQEIGRLD
jgi:hypothetical protein